MDINHIWTIKHVIGMIIMVIILYILCYLGHNAQGSPYSRAKGALVIMLLALSISGAIVGITFFFFG